MLFHQNLSPSSTKIMSLLDSKEVEEKKKIRSLLLSVEMPQQRSDGTDSTAAENGAFPVRPFGKCVWANFTSKKTYFIGVYYKMSCHDCAHAGLPCTPRMSVLPSWAVLTLKPCSSRRSALAMLVGSFILRKRPHPLSSAIRFPSGAWEELTAESWGRADGSKWAHTGPDPVCIPLPTARIPQVLFSHEDQHPHLLQAVWSISLEFEEELSVSLAASDAEEWSNSMEDFTPCCLKSQVMSCLVWMPNLFVSWPRLMKSSTWSDWPLVSRLRTPQITVLFFPEVHDELTKACRTHHSAPIHSYP